jgi:hypothetical protein
MPEVLALPVVDGEVSPHHRVVDADDLSHFTSQGWVLVALWSEPAVVHDQYGNRYNRNCECQLPELVPQQRFLVREPSTGERGYAVFEQMKRLRADNTKLQEQCASLSAENAGLLLEQERLVERADGLKDANVAASNNLEEQAKRLRKYSDYIAKQETEIAAVRVAIGGEAWRRYTAECHKDEG